MCLFSGLLLFIAGAALAYFVVVPLALPWLFGFGGPSLVPLITAEEYFSFVFSMVLTFGVSFELPIVVLALAALGIVTPQFLSKYRRHAIVVIVIIGAFLTPGDMVWTTIALAVPLYALYELSVVGRVRDLPTEGAPSRAARGRTGGGCRCEALARRGLPSTAGSRSAASARRFPRLPGAAGALSSRAPRDTTKDSTRFKWAAPDSVMRSSCCARRGYSVTRYQSDTAYFNAADPRSSTCSRRTSAATAVQRDSQTVVSDSGIYYTQATRHITTGGNYVITPGSGQADIVSTRPGRVDYVDGRTIVHAITNARLPVNNGETWYIDVALARVIVDSTSGKSATAYVRGGSMTSCDDTIPDYHFEYQGSEADRGQHDRGATGGAVHQGYSGDVAAVHLQRHAPRPPQRHSSAAVRRRRHRAQQLHRIGATSITSATTGR